MASKVPELFSADINGCSSRAALFGSRDSIWLPWVRWVDWIGWADGWVDWVDWIDWVDVLAIGVFKLIPVWECENGSSPKDYYQRNQKWKLIIA